MKRKLLILNIIFFSFFLMSCSSNIVVGISSSNEMEFPGYLKMELDENQYDLDTDVLLHASYGHD